jgi:hypothetical protein
VYSFVLIPIDSVKKKTKEHHTRSIARHQTIALFCLVSSVGSDRSQPDLASLFVWPSALPSVPRTALPVSDPPSQELPAEARVPAAALPRCFGCAAAAASPVFQRRSLPRRLVCCVSFLSRFLLKLSPYSVPSRIFECHSHNLSTTSCRYLSYETSISLLDRLLCRFSECFTLCGRIKK